MSSLSNPAAPRPLGELLTAGAAWLDARGVEDARCQCDLLAAHLLQIPRLHLPLEQRRLLEPSLIAALRDGVVRMGRHEPTQYVLGEWDFRGFTLKVDRRALIPRPETETLVQLVLNQEELWQVPTPAICDIGTGSGCIVISLALEAPQGCYSATDREADALALARENAERHGMANRIAFIHGEGCLHAPAASLDAIVSNPPYIATSVCATLPANIRDFEPDSALNGGPDGLTILRDIIHDAALRLKPHGWCFLEIGDDQGAAVRDLLENVGFTSVVILRDLAGKDRFARARMP